MSPDEFEEWQDDFKKRTILWDMALSRIAMRCGLTPQEADELARMTEDGRFEEEVMEKCGGIEGWLGQRRGGNA